MIIYDLHICFFNGKLLQFVALQFYRPQELQILTRGTSLMCYVRDKKLSPFHSWAVLGPSQISL